MDTFPPLPCLPYALVRPQIRSGDLLLCSGGSAMSRLIRAATDSVWSHVGVCLCLDTLNRIVVLESVESIGVRAAMLSRYVADHNGSGAPYPGRIVMARHTQVDFTAVPLLHTFSQRAIDLLGSPYDTQQLATIALRLVAAKLGLPPHPVADNTTFICSEFCHEVFRAIGVTVPYNRLNFITPDDFATCPEVTLLWEIALGEAP